jgi:hypothetical protein
MVGGKGKRRQDITKVLLENLYLKKKLSMYKIAGILNTTYRTIWKKLKKFDIKTRTISEANTKYPKLQFSKKLLEKAYLVGLRTGDISAKRNHKQIMVYTSTTHPAQFEMFKKSFEKYTHRIYVYSGTTPKGTKAWKISCNVHHSFDFLIPKLAKLPEWILNDKKLFYSFLAGYSDCEGNWDIGKQSESKKMRIRFRIKSGDKIILQQIQQKLIELNFRVRYSLERKAIDYGYNKDMYCLELLHKTDVMRLSNILLFLSKHSEKIWKMHFILNLSDKNWHEIKSELEEFRKLIKEARLNENLIKEQLSLPRANLISDEYSL